MAVGKMADPSMKNFDLSKKGLRRPWILFFYIVQINIIEKIDHNTVRVLYGGSILLVCIKIQSLQEACGCL